MSNVSPAFRQAVYAPARRTTARVTFDISDVTAADDNTSTVTSEAEISRKDQLTNQKRDRPSYATFEPDYWKLDGSFVLPPKATDIGHEVGWYSDTLSNDVGTFIPHQTIDFEFTEVHSSIGLTITFDTPANEYASDFDIVAYNSVGGVISSVQVRENTLARYVLEELLYQYKRIVITIRKWCKPNRRAKVTEVSFGVVREYAGESLIRMNLIEQISTTSDTVAANELKFTVDNSKKEFNILNPDGFYKFLQERQAATLEIGVELTPRSNNFEYVDLGLYFLRDWQSDEGSLTTTFTARNRIDFIPNIEIENESGTSTNLHDLAVSVLTLAGVKTYSLDPTLASIPTNGAHKKMTYRTLLQSIAIAGCCVMYVDRADRLHITRLSSGNSVDTLTFDNIYREPQIKLDKLVSRVEVAIYSGVSQVDAYVLESETKGGATLKVENTLINSLGHAQTVAQWILAEANERALYDVNWRQNPALECGDIVSIEDRFSGHKHSRIVSQEYEYAGYLRGKTKTKGGI